MLAACSDTSIPRRRGITRRVSLQLRHEGTRRQVNRISRRNQPEQTWCFTTDRIESCTSQGIRLSWLHRLLKQQVFWQNHEVYHISSLSWPRLFCSSIYHQQQQQWTRLQLQWSAQLERKGGVQEWISRKGLLLCRSGKVFWPGCFFHKGSMVVPQYLSDNS